ncbi:MAG: hypothetical protein ACI383_07375 [Rummeliibacillus sp.]
MYNVHFYDNKIIVLSQLRETLPLVNDPIKIKGRKGTVNDIIKISEKTIHVQVTFEKVKNKLNLSKEIGKKRK